MMTTAQKYMGLDNLEKKKFNYIIPVIIIVIRTAQNCMEWQV